MKKNTASPKDGRPGTNKTAIGRQEKDIDDLVHDEVNEAASDPQEEDLDDKVHRVIRPATSAMDQLNSAIEDPDDLVHGYQEEDEQ